MKMDFKGKGWRIAVGITAPLLVAFVAFCLYYFKEGLPCMFYKMSGIYCPGCGAGRASVALLHGDILSAIDYNLFFMLLLPFAAYYLLKIYIAYVFGKDVLPFFRIRWGIGVGALIFVLAFWILRNIPVFPLTYLAP